MELYVERGFEQTTVAEIAKRAGLTERTFFRHFADKRDYADDRHYNSCAACHGQQLEGVAAPALKGPAFGEMATAQALTADALLDVIANTMPQSDPGSLKPDDYNAVTAYILQQNGYPSGSAPLDLTRP